MDRKRILEKIQKALNLAKDGAATAGEAAAAMNSAQKMMAHYEIDEKELGLVGIGRERIRTAIQASKNIPLHMSALNSLVCRAFGVRCVMEAEIRVSDPNWTINYFGPEHRIAMAAYTHVVLQRAIDKGWAQFLSANPHLKKERGARTGYVLGWVSAASQQVMQLSMTDVEKAGTDLLVEQEFPDVTKSKARKMAIDRDAANAGTRDGKGFSIHRPMNQGAEALKIGN
jgi:hypothetical protein